MALTLSMHPHDVFYLNDDRFLVDEVFLSEGFTVIDPQGKKHQVDASKAVEIAPGVKVSDGNRLIVGKARVVFQAPKEVTILREELYCDALQIMPDAIEEAARLDLTPKQVREMTDQSAPVTHDLGNRRFEKYVIDVAEDGMILGICLMTDELADDEVAA